MRIVVGITGASGVIMGYHLVKALKLHNCEVHLVISEGAARNWELETDISIDELIKISDFVYSNSNLAAKISSGSFYTDGAIIIPCSMKTLSAIAAGYASTLIVRSVDVCLKENRKVVIIPREMPLGKIHLKNLLKTSKLGCTIIPPMLTFYNSPKSLEDQINHIVGKVLMQFGMNYLEFIPWTGD